MNLKENLKNIRRDHNLSQEQLAEKLNVSRQSVSKWESGTAYPEMDKVIQLCKLFDLNIDDLLNQDIKEVKNNKQSKTNLNKFVDEFFVYITKTIEMFSQLTIKEKIKCLLEQLTIALTILIVGNVIGIVLSRIVREILSILPSSLFHLLYSLVTSAYSLSFFIISVIVILHVFKIRYLDYYVKEEMIDQPKEEKTSETKVIIRDPNHSSYKFINNLFKVAIFFVKALLAMIGSLFCLTLIFLVTLLALTFLITKTGFLFIGLFLLIMAGVIINVIVLFIIYSILFNNKIKNNIVALIFLTTIFLIGISLAFTTLGIAKIDYIEHGNEIKTVNIPMSNNLVIKNNYYNVNYVEKKIDDVQIEIKHSKIYKVKLENIKENVYHIKYEETKNQLEVFKDMIKDLNDLKFIDNYNYQINIYASKENINKLKNNYDNLNKEELNNYYLNEIDNLNQVIEELNKKINEFEYNN